MTRHTASAAMSLRHRLLRGAKSYGPMILSDSPVVAELLGHVGYDHIVVDHEHSMTDVKSGAALLRAIDAAAGVNNNGRRRRTEPIVRTPSADPVYLKKILDTLRLPAGVLVPMVDSVEMAQEVVQATRYPWQEQQQHDGAMDTDIDTTRIDGTRGCAIPFVRASAWNFQQDYLQRAQEDLLLMVQVESEQGVEAIPEIANVPGIDGIFLGPLDLACSVGLYGHFDHPRVAGTIRRAEEAILDSPAFLAGFKAPNRTVEQMFEAGYSLVCGSIDLGLLRAVALQDWEQGRAAGACGADATTIDTSDCEQERN